MMVQPGVAAIMLSDDELADQGMLSRCLVIAPESHAGRRFYREQAPETKNKLMEYERRLHDILQRKFPLATNNRNVLAPRVLRLSADATKVWRTFADHVEGQIGPAGALEPIIGFANKLPEHAARPRRRADAGRGSRRYGDRAGVYGSRNCYRAALFERSTSPVPRRQDRPRPAPCRPASRLAGFVG